MTGPKIINLKTLSKRVIEDELDELRRPNAFTYSPDDRKVKTKLPEFTFPKDHRGERTPSPDRRKALEVSHKLTKKEAKAARILPEHNITER